jgi:hypothetical protein
MVTAGSIQDSPEATYTFTFSEFGSYPIRARLTSDCGSLTSTDEIVVNINRAEQPGWTQQLALHPQPHSRRMANPRKWVAGCRIP